MARGQVPGQYHKQFRVDAPVLTSKEPKSSDGLPLRSLTQIGDLMERVTYVGDIERLDGQWGLLLQWIDLDGTAHRIRLPHGVIERILTHCNAIMDTARSDRAKAGAATRRANAWLDDEEGEDGN